VIVDKIFVVGLQWFNKYNQLFYGRGLFPEMQIYPAEGHSA